MTRLSEDTNHNDALSPPKHRTSSSSCARTVSRAALPLLLTPYLAIAVFSTFATR